MSSDAPLGASYQGDGRCVFLVWAPFAAAMELHLVAPEDRVVAMDRLERGYYSADIRRVSPGSLYFYRLDSGAERPDPASRFQPRGVHGPSQVVDRSAFNWSGQLWFGLPLQDYIIYELHTGAFTPEGTFQAIIPRLDDLVELGITALELMPVAQFPGTRNWGYDGVYPFAVQDSYGGPDGLKMLVDACHARGLAVVLDVVYNHLGPEGNYLSLYGPYFSNTYRTPWGDAINYDGPRSDDVRRFFIENALYWLTEFRIDALRLDAIHGIRDFSARPFLQEVAEAVHEQGELLNRRLYVIAESSLNDARVILPGYLGGHGLDAQWNDDFHHSLHALITGERSGYYQDFGEPGHLARAYREGFVYSGQYSPFRGRRHGNSSRPASAHQFVVSMQTHDQVGNRAGSDRLADLVSFDQLKLAAGAVLLSPFVPLLFMGEEYAETAPFLYFTSHSDPDLVEAVSRGRRAEFASFDWEGDMPDPQDEATFRRSRLQWDKAGDGRHRVLREFYRQLIRLRKEVPALRRLSKDELEIFEFEKQKCLFLRRWNREEQAIITLNFSAGQADITAPVPPGDWVKLLDSASEEWMGAGPVMPDEIRSEGEASLRLPAWSLTLFVLQPRRVR